MSEVEQVVALPVSTPLDWCAQSDIRIAAEMVKIGCCPICILRFANYRSEDFYQLPEPQLIEAMFPTDTVETVLSVDSISSPFDAVPTGDALTSLFATMKKTLLDRSDCVCCLDLFTPAPSFYRFIGEAVTSADFEFSDVSLFKTLPSNVIVRQYGVWKHLNLLYGSSIPRFSNPNFEGHVVELKEGSKLVHNPRIIAALNTARISHNEAIASGRPGLIPPRPNGHSYNTPDDTRIINQGVITFNQYSTFHVNVIFMSERIENEDELRVHLDAGMKKFDTKNPKYAGGASNSNSTAVNNRQQVANSMSVNSNLMKLLPKIHPDTLRRLKICPPVLPSKVINQASVVQAFGACHSAKAAPIEGMQNEAQQEEDKFYHCKRVRRMGIHERKVVTSDEIDTPEKISEKDKEKESNLVVLTDNTNGVARGRVTIMSPYLCAEISCQHDNILLEANYLKLSRVTSQTSWYMEPINVSAALTTNSSDSASAKTTLQSITPVSTGGNNENEAEEYTGPIAETAVDAELGFRIVPHFRPTDVGLDVPPPTYCRGMNGEPLLCADILSKYTYIPGDLIRREDINIERIVNASGFRFKFHSSGREDLNVRMLGQGRPMFLELVNPRRLPPLTTEWCEAMEREVNAHTVSAKLLQLRPGNQQSFDAMVKGIAEKRKRYRCVVYCETPLKGPSSLDILNTATAKKKIQKMIDGEEKEVEADEEGELVISQQTPIRVLFRRTAMERKRSIYALSARYINKHWFYLDLETQAGTYVKEFVHSDRGRTRPSISELVGTQCTITQLDVTELVL